MFGGSHNVWFAQNAKSFSPGLERVCPLMVAPIPLFGREGFNSFAVEVQRWPFMAKPLKNKSGFAHS